MKLLQKSDIDWDGSIKLQMKNRMGQLKIVYGCCKQHCSCVGTLNTSVVLLTVCMQTA